MDEKKKNDPEFYEKRKAPRVEKEITAQYHLKDDSTRFDITATKNISEKGASFNAGTYFGKDTILTLCLRLPAYDQCVEVDAKVISCKGTKSGIIHLVGVEFVNLNDSLKGSLKIFVKKYLEVIGENDGEN